MMCGCILGWRSVAYHFRVTVTLTSDLDFRIIVSGAYLLCPIHMHKIYTCKYFALWSKYTHVSKRIITLCSHANSVHISILKGTHTCCTADMYRLLMTATKIICELVLHMGCLKKNY